MLVTPQPERLGYIRFAFERGMTVREVARLTGMDPWFLHQITRDHARPMKIAVTSPKTMHAESNCAASSASASPTSASPRSGSSKATTAPSRCASCARSTASSPVFKLVDTCAAEFDRMTPYLYSTYDEEDEAPPTDKPKIIILGSGPNRIGQGIEFDYCCCHAAFALSDDGYETIMVNCNPETVSTDYDTSDRLYFEPLDLEDVLAVYNHEAQSRRDDRHDRPVRRPDPAEPRPAPARRRRAHHRNLA